MSDHTNKQFDAEMEAIRSGVLSMGGIVEQQLTRAIEALGTDEDAGRLDAVASRPPSICG
jgi:phosphate transport system protein